MQWETERWLKDQQWSTQTRQNTESFLSNTYPTKAYGELICPRRRNRSWYSSSASNHTQITMRSHTTWNSYTCFLSFPASANRQTLFHRFSYHNESQKCFICFPVSENHKTCSSNYSTSPQIITNHVPSVHLSQRIIKMFHLISYHRESQNWLMSQIMANRFHKFPCQM